ncbi:transposase [Burkholderia ambifaria]|nr:transposase [Burkholderia ambifaria]
MRKQSDEFAVQVERLVLAHGLWPALTSMPGAGVRTAARLLTAVAHKIFSFPSAYADLTPVIRRSGSSIPGEQPSGRDNKVLKRLAPVRVPCIARPRLGGLRCPQVPRGQASQSSARCALTATLRCSVHHAGNGTI